MADKYYWSLTQMQGLESCTSRMDQGVNDALKQVDALIAAVRSDPAWTGEHKVMFLAWLDLMRQYNAKLADAEVGATVDQKLKVFTNQLSKFYSDSPSMARLRTIS